MPALKSTDSQQQPSRSLTKVNDWTDRFALWREKQTPFWFQSTEGYRNGLIAKWEAVTELEPKPKPQPQNDEHEEEKAEDDSNKRGNEALPENDLGNQTLSEGCTVNEACEAYMSKFVKNDDDKVKVRSNWLSIYNPFRAIQAWMHRDDQGQLVEPENASETQKETLKLLREREELVKIWKRFNQEFPALVAERALEVKRAIKKQDKIAETFYSRHIGPYTPWASLQNAQRWTFGVAAATAFTAAVLAVLAVAFPGFVIPGTAVSASAIVSFAVSQIVAGAALSGVSLGTVSVTLPVIGTFATPAAMLIGLGALLYIGLGAAYLAARPFGSGETEAQKKLFGGLHYHHLSEEVVKKSSVVEAWFEAVAFPIVYGPFEQIEPNFSYDFTGKVTSYVQSWGFQRKDKDKDKESIATEHYAKKALAFALEDTGKNKLDKFENVGSVPLNPIIFLVKEHIILAITNPVRTIAAINNAIHGLYSATVVTLGVSFSWAFGNLVEYVHGPKLDAERVGWLKAEGEGYKHYILRGLRNTGNLIYEGLLETGHYANRAIDGLLKPFALALDIVLLPWSALVRSIDLAIEFVARFISGYNEYRAERLESIKKEMNRDNAPDSVESVNQGVNQDNAPDPLELTTGESETKKGENTGKNVSTTEKENTTVTNTETEAAESGQSGNKALKGYDEEFVAAVLKEMNLHNIFKIVLGPLSIDSVASLMLANGISADTQLSPDPEDKQKQLIDIVETIHRGAINLSYSKQNLIAVYNEMAKSKIFDSIIGDSRPAQSDELHDLNLHKVARALFTSGVSEEADFNGGMKGILALIMNKHDLSEEHEEHFTASPLRLATTNQGGKNSKTEGEQFVEEKQSQNINKSSDQSVVAEFGNK